MKIVYVYSTMVTAGGTERTITEKANYLSERFGYDIIIISCFQLPNEDNYFHISNKIKQINLGIPYFSQYKFKYPKRLWIKWQMNRLLKKSISEVVKHVDPDILIGVSRFKANYISSIRCRAKKIIECHESRYSTIYDASESRSIFSKIFLKIYSFCYFKTIERNADAIVTLTEGDKNLWRRAKRVVVIPNFSAITVGKISDCTTKRVIAIGRLAWEKGFDRLIEAWGIISSKHADWHLDIFGQGRMHDTLIALTKKHHANNLTIHNPTSNISQEYTNSSICAVTSHFEGFSLVLLEAMKHGIPCVAFDCPFGPASIIKDSSCGFLVKNGDTRLLAEKICFLIENEGLRKDFSKAALERANTLDIDIIMNKWIYFYKQIININNNQRNFLLKEMTLKDVQDVSLNIMKEFHQFCITHNINYSMGFGTLLGAIRHKGFIPWDDDIDVVMLRADYDKFCEIWNDTPNYKLYNFERGNMYAACSRLCDIRHTYVKTEMPLFTEQTGVWIDIFPLDYIEDDHGVFLKRNHLVKEAHLNVFKKRYAMISWGDKVTDLKSAIKWVGKNILYHENIMKLVNHQVKLCRSFSPPSHRVCCLSFPTYVDREFTPIHVFDDYKELPFEDTHFYAMKGYDEYLHGLYDNYMQMPPKEKQVRGHCFHKYYWRE